MTNPDDLYYHFSESFHFLKSKYGNDLHFLLLGDSNKLNLRPILKLSQDLAQVVKVPTRLNPPAILDTIVTTFQELYKDPVAKPPLESNSENGHPSDHQIVLWEPLSKYQDIPKRDYRMVSFRPLPQSRINDFGRWLNEQNWHEIYALTTVDEKVESFQNILMQKFYSIFPLKEFKVSQDDKPWISKQLKMLDRQKRREFYKHKKSDKWKIMNAEYKERLKTDKAAYSKNLVEDLKTSKPGLWYSKVKRMGALSSKHEEVFVEELSPFDTNVQANKLADFYASTRNQFEPINSSMFPEFNNMDYSDGLNDLLIEPSKISMVVSKMNKKSSSVAGDLPMKLITQFSNELSLPLTNIINTIFESKSYPKTWKRETLTPIPKVYPAESMKDLRPISGLRNFAKFFDRIIAEYMTEDMSKKPDAHQYGNQKGLSVNHYLINLIHKLLVGVDKNSAENKNAAILVMVMR